MQITVISQCSIVIFSAVGQGRAALLPGSQLQLLLLLHCVPPGAPRAAVARQLAQVVLNRERKDVETPDIDLKLLQCYRFSNITHIEGLHDALDEGVGPGVLQAEAGPPQQPDRGGGAGEDDEGVAGPSDRPAAV